MPAIHFSLIDGIGAARVDLLLRIVNLRIVEVTVRAPLNVLFLLLHDSGTLRRLHHGQDLGETLSVLIIDHKNVTLDRFNLANKIYGTHRELTLANNE